MAIGIGRLIKRYSLVILVPAFVVSTIFADYSRTRLYKVKLERENQKENVSDHT